jgi:hypothetical protein
MRNREGGFVRFGLLQTQSGQFEPQLQIPSKRKVKEDENNREPSA